MLFNSLSSDIVGINPQADNHSSSSQAADLNGGNEDGDWVMMMVVVVILEFHLKLSEVSLVERPLVIGQSR